MITRYYGQWTETPAAADRYDASRRALLRDALAGERSADVLRLALARRRRDWEEGVCLAHYCVVCLRLIDSLEASARAMRRRSTLNKTGG